MKMYSQNQPLQHPQVFPPSTQEPNFNQSPLSSPISALSPHSNNLPDITELPQPETTLLSFFKDSFLSDALLKLTDTDLPFHKVILSASSKFIYELLKQYPSLPKTDDGKTIVQLPEPIVSTVSQGNLKESIELVMKYCYANQDFNVIRNDLNIDNVFTVLSIAHCLGIKSLMLSLERFVVESVVSEENATKIVNEAIVYELQKLKEVCVGKINNAFANVGNLNGVFDLNFETFKNVVCSDMLDVPNENVVCDIVLEYINQRRKVVEEMKGQSQLLMLEEDKKKLQMQMQNASIEKPLEIIEGKLQQEGEAPKEQGSELKPLEDKPLDDKPPEDKPPEDKPPEDKPPEDKPPEDKPLDDKPPEVEEPKPVEKEDKKIDDFKKIETIPEDPKEQIVTLQNSNPNEMYDTWKNTITKLKSSLLKQPLTPEQERELILCIRFSFLSHGELLSYASHPLLFPHKDLVLEGLSVRLNKFEGTNQGPLQINLTPRKNYIQPQQQQQQQLPEQQQQQQQPQPQSNINHPYQPANTRYFNNDLEMNKQTTNLLPHQPLHNINPNLKTDTASHTDYHNNSQSHIKDIINIDDYNSLAFNKANLKSTPIRPPQDPKISESFHKNISLLNKYRPLFKYEYDFDENGVFFYLGSMGKTSPYRNPYEIGQVKVFASSIGKGSPGDFVGRNLVNLRTMNEEHSYFGVDLGEERFLIPSSYSIKNRNSSGHVMLCWNLEGSNDKVNYEVIDTRIFQNTSNEKFNLSLEKERNLLKQPGCTSTWGVSRKIRERFPNGFRYFVLKQIDKNSSGGYNMTISGFELYGEGVGRNWNFN